MSMTILQNNSYKFIHSQYTQEYWELCKLIFQPMNSVRSNKLSLKYQRFTSSGCKDIGTIKSEFVGKAYCRFQCKIYFYVYIKYNDYSYLRDYLMYIHILWNMNIIKISYFLLSEGSDLSP